MIPPASRSRSGSLVCGSPRAMLIKPSRPNMTAVQPTTCRPAGPLRSGWRSVRQAISDQQHRRDVGQRADHAGRRRRGWPADRPGQAPPELRGRPRSRSRPGTARSRRGAGPDRRRARPGRAVGRRSRRRGPVRARPPQVRDRAGPSMTAVTPATGRCSAQLGSSDAARAPAWAVFRSRGTPPEPPGAFCSPRRTSSFFPPTEVSSTGCQSQYVHETAVGKTRGSP